MLHQIRKMVALAIGIARNLASEETLLESFKTEKMDIPIVPGLGLVLHHVRFYTLLYINWGNYFLTATQKLIHMSDKCIIEAFRI